MLPMLWANHEQVKAAYADCAARLARLVEAVLRAEPSPRRWWKPWTWFGQPRKGA